MPAKRVSGGAARPRGYFATAYDTVTAPDNQAVVRSLAVFGVAVGFLASPFGDFLLPPL